MPGLGNRLLILVIVPSLYENNFSATPMTMGLAADVLSAAGWIVAVSTGGGVGRCTGILICRTAAAGSQQC